MKFNPYKVRKRFIDPFQDQKKRAINALEASQKGAPPRTHEEESAAILNHVERVLMALEHHDQSRHNLFLKLVIAWVVAYSLTVGETPWVVKALWRGVMATVGVDG